MKSNFILLSVTALLVGSMAFLDFDQTITSPLAEEEKETAVDEWLYMQKAFPYDGPDKAAQKAAVQHMLAGRKAQANARLTSDDEWQHIGPFNIGGRVRDIACPYGNDNTIYVGAASGGVLKSTDGGSTWRTIFDTEATLSVGDIAIDPVDTNKIYVGTGEPGNGVGSVTYDGNGIYRSLDGGENWTNIGLTNGGNTGRIAINPQNTNIIFAAMLGDLFENTPDRGIYRTTDGGTSWEKVLYVNDSTGGIDVCINPENPNIIFASTWERVRRYNRRDYNGLGSRIYRSEDGGDTWEMLTNGLPVGANELSKITLYIAPSNPDIIYAGVVGTGDKLKDIYKSTDGGDTWIGLNCVTEVNTTSQDNWFGGVRVDPFNANIVYWVGFIVSRSMDGGLTWSDVMEDAHVDCQALYLSPTDPDFKIMGGDGGLFFTYDDFDDYTLEQNIPITQLYTIDVFPTDTSRIIGGAQDNGSFVRNELNYWEFVNWGDGVSTKFVPVDENSFFGNYQYGGYYGIVDGIERYAFGFEGGERFNWRSPIEVSPTDPAVIYFGGNHVYKSENYGSNVTRISDDLTNGSQGTGLTFGSIFTIHNAPANSDYIYVGTDDANVWRTSNGGDDWTLITDGLPYRYCMSIETHPDNAEEVYVAFSGFRWAEDIAHIYKSTDAGSTWTPIDGDLPDIPVNDIQVFTSGDSTGLVIATDVGCYYSYDDGAHWLALGSEMPIVSVYEIYYDSNTGYVFAGTYGRGAWKIKMPRAAVQVEVDMSDLAMVLNLYPNPATDYAALHFNLAVQQGMVEVMNMEGKILQTLHFDQRRDVPLPISQLPAGQYMLRVQADGSNWIKTLVKI